MVVETRDLHLEFIVRLREVPIRIELCEFPRAFAALERMQAIAEQTRQPTQRWNAGFMASAMMVLRGDLEAGERVGEDALRIGQEAGHADAAMIYGGNLVACRMFQGRGAEVVGLIEQMVANNPGVPAWEAALGYTYCLIDRHAEGADVLARAAARRFDLPRDQNQSCGWAMYADTAAQTRSVEAAAMLYELLEPYADQFFSGGGVNFGHARLSLALLDATLGRHEQADAHFAFACDFHRENGLRVWETRSELGWAEGLVARGDGPSAREHAARALELARRHGYGAFEPRAAAIVASDATVKT
jgi:hypothetical protein